MKKHIIISLLLITSSSLNAQKWALRLGFHNLKSFSYPTINHLTDKRGDLKINSDKFYTLLLIGNRFYAAPQLSNFWDITLTYNIKGRKGVMLGTRVMSPIIYSSISNTFGTHTHGEGTSIPVIRLNYTYELLKSKKENPSSLSVFSGIALNFRTLGGSFSSGGWGSATGALDSSGNFYFEYTSAKVVRAYGPNYPMPYINAGLDAALRLGKRWKFGFEMAFYAGTKTLYTQEIVGNTNDANFAYTLTLKPYFISGGIYFQYRIK